MEEKKVDLRPFHPSSWKRREVYVTRFENVDLFHGDLTWNKQNLIKER